MESCLPEILKKNQNFIKLYQLPTIRTLRNSNEFFVLLRVRIIESLLYIQATIECGFTLKRVRDMIRTYSQMHRTDKYSQHSSIVWPVWLNG